MKRTTAGIFLIALTLATPVPAAESGALTVQRLVLLSTSTEAAKLRHHRYPGAEELKRVLGLMVTAYSRDLPYRDEWGTPFRFAPSEDHLHITITSAGPDRAFATGGCGDDYSMRDGTGVCPPSQSLSVEPAAVRRLAQKLTMREMGAVASVVEGYKQEHKRYPKDLETIRRSAVEYSVHPNSWQDAWGTQLRYEATSDRLHFLLISAGSDRMFQPSRDRVSEADWRSSLEFDDPEGDIVSGGLGWFLEAPRGLASALDHVTWIDVIEQPLRVRPEGTLTVSRDQWVSFEVVVKAPRDDSGVERLTVDAQNQGDGLLGNRPRPNLFLSVARIGAPAGASTVRLRIATRGEGSSSREQFSAVVLDLLASEDERQARLRQVLAKMPEVSAAQSDPTMAAKMIALLDTRYVSNPPGTYDLAIEYRPIAGPWTHHPLIHHVRLVVNEGPDSLERLEAASQ